LAGTALINLFVAVVILAIAKWQVLWRTGWISWVLAGGLVLDDTRVFEGVVIVAVGPKAVGADTVAIAV